MLARVSAGDASRPAGATAQTYVYATTLMRDRSRYVLGLPRLTPPGGGRGWEVCAISYVREGLMVSWRCPSHLQFDDKPK